MNKYRILVKGIVQKGNRYLTVEKWYDDNIVEPYQWEFIDGEAEFGESPDKADGTYYGSRQSSLYMDIYDWLRVQSGTGVSLPYRTGRG